MKRKTVTFAAALLAGVWGIPAAAEYPTGPVTLINPNSAGGATDIGIRTWLPYMEKCLAEKGEVDSATLVVIAKPGGSGGIGMTELALSAPDGNTIGIVPVPNLIATTISKEMRYSPASFEFLGTLVRASTTVAVRNDSPWKTFEDLVNHIRSSDAPLKIAVVGQGGDDHLSALQFETELGKDVTIIPAGGGAEANVALLGGHVDVAFMSDVVASQFLDSVRPLAIAAEKRNVTFPDTPTFREKGLDIVQGSAHVISAPKGVSEEVRNNWSACIGEIAQDQAFLDDAKKRGVPVNHMTQEQVDEYIAYQERVLKHLWEVNPWVSK